MGIEVEVKARLDSVEAFVDRIQGSATFVRSYRKEDRYYAPVAGGPTQFRLRRDGSAWICTFKDKTILDGIERSAETEFTVSDGHAFEALVGRLGYRCDVSKIKVGRSWRLDGVTVEVSTVNTLGAFAEFEILLPDDAADGAIETARSRLRSLLTRFGLADSAIEPRPYIDLIYEDVSYDPASPCAPL